MIKLIIEDPHSHTSQELRTAIHYLSSVAADVERERHANEGVETVPLADLSLKTHWPEVLKPSLKVQELLKGTDSQALHDVAQFADLMTGQGRADFAAVVEGAGEVVERRTTLALDPVDPPSIDLEQTDSSDSAAAEELETITQPATIPPVEYETVVTGYADGRTPYAAGHSRESYEAAGWTLQALLDAGHLVEVTEQVPKPSAAIASVDIPAPAPAAPAPSAPASSAAVEVDKAGLPWDARIHSNAEVKKAATGLWKRRKNLTDEYVAQIEAELRELMAVPAGGAPAPDTATTATAAPTPPVPPTPSAQAAAPVPPAPGAASAEPTTFAELMRWVTGHVGAKNLEQSHVQVALREIGLKSLPDLNTRPDLIPTFVAKVTDDYL